MALLARYAVMLEQSGCARHDAQSKCHAACAPLVLLRLTTAHSNLKTLKISSLYNPNPLNIKILYASIDLNIVMEQCNDLNDYGNQNIESSSKIIRIKYWRDSISRSQSFPPYSKYFPQVLTGSGLDQKADIFKNFPELARPSYGTRRQKKEFI